MPRPYLQPAQAILLLRGVCKGEPTATIAREIGLTRQTVHDLRKAIQANAEGLQPREPLPDRQTGTDEMFQNAGEKGEPHCDPNDPPRRRANKRRGHGTYENDRPPVVGTVGRESGQVRLRMAHHTDEETLVRHVHTFTLAEAVVFTDEWQSYDHIIRVHLTVCHGAKEWAREDGDGICEIHVNTTEGMWTTVRNFWRPLRGFIRNTSADTLPCASSASISSRLRLHLSQLWPPCTRFGHEPSVFSQLRVYIQLVSSIRVKVIEVPSASNIGDIRPEYFLCELIKNKNAMPVRGKSLQIELRNIVLLLLLSLDP